MIDLKYDPVIEEGVELTPCQDSALEMLLDWYDNSKEVAACLYGAAGTGKSFFTNVFLKNINLRFVRTVCSAPTHKAKEVIRDFTGLDTHTLQSLLGLAPNTDLEEFDIRNVVFDKKNRPVLPQYQLVLIDECSMINSDLYDFLIEQCKSNRVRVLFIGDKSQLPPVGEETSKCFTETERIAYLVTPARQKPSNPLLYMLMALRYDIEPNVENLEVFVEVAGKFGISLDDLTYTYMTEIYMQGVGMVELAQPLPRNLFSACRKHRDIYINEDEGFEFTNDFDAFQREVLESYTSEKFAENSDYCRYLAFTNKNVSEWNKIIRRGLFGDDVGDITNGDFLLGYRGARIFQDGTYLTLITNSKEYYVSDVSEGSEQVTIILAEGESAVITLDVFYCNISTVKGGWGTPIMFVKKDSYHEFKRAHGYFHKMAFKFKKWRQYYDFKNKFLLFEDISHLYQYKKKSPPKDMDYGFGLTIHKSQGSTFEKTFVHGSNVVSYIQTNKHFIETQNERPITKEEMEQARAFVFRLMYVALSRSSGVCKIFLL